MVMVARSEIFRFFGPVSYTHLAIATSVQIQSKKTKAALLEELSALSEIQLDKYVHEKYWVLTEKGQKELDCNKYIQFFLEKHSYALEEIGIDLWVVNEAIIQNPKVRYRDEIWHLLNKKENEISIKIQTEPYSGTGLTNLYCNIYRAMALFVEEEGQMCIRDRPRLRCRKVPEKKL